MHFHSIAIKLQFEFNNYLLTHKILNIRPYHKDAFKGHFTDFPLVSYQEGTAMHANDKYTIFTCTVNWELSILAANKKSFLLLTKTSIVCVVIK